MNLKWIGAVCVMVGCGGWGCLIASQYRYRIRLVRELIKALVYMISELQYRCTPLPQLCQQLSEYCRGRIGRLFLTLSEELSAQVSPNLDRCMSAALDKHRELPGDLHHLFRILGSSLGLFDVGGQIRALEAVKKECDEYLMSLLADKDTRLRSYQTLGLCAGAAIAILFV